MAAAPLSEYETYEALQRMVDAGWLEVVGRRDPGLAPPPLDPAGRRARPRGARWERDLAVAVLLIAAVAVLRVTAHFVTPAAPRPAATDIFAAAQLRDVRMALDLYRREHGAYPAEAPASWWRTRWLSRDQLRVAGHDLSYRCGRRRAGVPARPDRRPVAGRSAPRGRALPLLRGLPGGQDPGRGGRQVVADEVGSAARRRIPERLLLLASVARAHEDAPRARPLPRLRVDQLVAHHEGAPQRQQVVLGGALEQPGAGLAAGTALLGPVRTEVDAVQLDPRGPQLDPQAGHRLVHAREREEPAPHARLVRDHDDRQAGGLEIVQRVRRARQELEARPGPRGSHARRPACRRGPRRPRAAVRARAAGPGPARRSARAPRCPDAWRPERAAVPPAATGRSARGRAPADRPAGPAHRPRRSVPRRGACSRRRAPRQPQRPTEAASSASTMQRARTSQPARAGPHGPRSAQHDVRRVPRERHARPGRHAAVAGSPAGKAGRGHPATGPRGPAARGPAASASASRPAGRRAPCTRTLTRPPPARPSSPSPPRTASRQG